MKRYGESQVDQFRLENLLPVGWKFIEARGSNGEKTLFCDIEAIHACTTGNNNTYLSEELRKATSSWTTPYRKPVLMNHDTMDGEPIGRVVSAKMGFSEVAKQDCIVLRVEIMDPDAAPKVLDGRYVTVSVGSRCEKALCSICGQDWIHEGWCDHDIGEKYKGQTCTAILKGIKFNEVSFVNVPADSNAVVVGIVQEGYLFRKDSLGGKFLISLADPGVNLLEGQGGMQIMEALGIKEAEQLHVLLEAHDALHVQFAAGQSEALLTAHTEIVRQMFEKSLEHVMTDTLDDGLPEDLRPAQPPTLETEPDFGRFAEILVASRQALDAAVAELVTRTTELTVKTQELEAAVAVSVQLTTERDTLQATVDQLTEQSVVSETELRRVIAEQILEFRLPAPENREAALEEYIGKPKDVLQALLVESRSQIRELYHIEDPTVHQEAKPELSLAQKKEGLKGLFGGPSRARASRKKEV